MLLYDSISHERFIFCECQRPLWFARSRPFDWQLLDTMLIFWWSMGSQSQQRSRRLVLNLHTKLIQCNVHTVSIWYNWRYFTYHIMQSDRGRPKNRRISKQTDEQVSKRKCIRKDNLLYAVSSSPYSCSIYVVLHYMIMQHLNKKSNTSGTLFDSRITAMFLICFIGSGWWRFMRDNFSSNFHF